MELEVLLYINTVKEYFGKTPVVSEYIIGNNSLEYFYEMVEKIAVNNYNQNKEPRIKREQFELLRKSRKIKNVFTYTFGDNIILN